MDSQGLRSAFTSFFAGRGHHVVPSASLIPHDPTVLFTIAGMVPFKPYFVGEETAPWPRATSVQKCFRTLDIDIVGTTQRHLTFFEMLGNFSFGDYFKEDAIPMAWELVTSVLGFDPALLWITVHHSDDDAAAVWVDKVGVDPSRVQRMGDDNFWSMGDTGPCGPCSEIYYDQGESWGEDGGPAHGGTERFVEIWNLVFMQFDRQADRSLIDLPRPSIDTGAGLERILPLVQGVPSLFQTDLMVPLIESAQEVTDLLYGREPSTDISLRIMADHSRAMTMLVSDGVLPSNDGRGYVLRRIIRRAVGRAHRLGVSRAVLPRMIDTAIAVLGPAYPDLVTEADLIKTTIDREESMFLRTLQSGSQALADELAKGTGRIQGEVAFTLHDTHGFPIEMTMEMAQEAGASVDRAGFDAAMERQRSRAKADSRAKRAASGSEADYRSVLDLFGPTVFTGYDTLEEPAAQVLEVLGGATANSAEIILARTPFYPEGGGQTGDRGTIVTAGGRAEVLDTQQVLTGVIVHKVILEGEILAGEEAVATVDNVRREATRRHHTATHLLHAALREVLGDQVRQQGSLVSPERLRFDFSHHGAVSETDLEQIAALVNQRIMSDEPVEVVELPKDEAVSMGALAFFGDKYGERVRVVKAGSNSVELCGGTHVRTLGSIGPVAILSESSIGSGTRRIEAVSGPGALHLWDERSERLAEISRLLKVEPSAAVDAVEKLLERQRAAEKELHRLRSQSLAAEAGALVDQAVEGVLVARRDGMAADELRELAGALRSRSSTIRTVLAGSPDGHKVAIVVSTGGTPPAGDVIKVLATIVGGGGGGSPELAVAGGRDVSRVDDLLAEAARLLGGS